MLPLPEGCHIAMESIDFLQLCNVDVISVVNDIKAVTGSHYTDVIMDAIAA